MQYCELGIHTEDFCFKNTNSLNTFSQLIFKHPSNKKAKYMSSSKC